MWKANRCIIALLALACISAAPKDAPKDGVTRTKAEADKLIDDAGKTPPDWWDATELKYPPTLDLTWKNNPGGWQPQKNIGAYLWDIIDPNPSRWREGVKLVQHTLTVNKGDADAQKKAMGSLAKFYTELLEDYPRGAFWAKKHGNQPILLAECYFKLGCTPAAIEILKKIGDDDTRNGQIIKLWADVGDLKTALALAQKKVADGDPSAAYLAAGDACRRAGDARQAAKFYEQVLAITKSDERDLPVNKKRAAASLEAIKLFDLLDLSKIDDGVYKADSVGYVGPVEVSVTIKSHRIDDVKVTSHHEKQFYASLTAVPARIIQKQSVTGIDSTTGATVTSEAIINATAKALAGAKK